MALRPCSSLPSTAVTAASTAADIASRAPAGKAKFGRSRHPLALSPARVELLAPVAPAIPVSATAIVDGNGSRALPPKGLPLLNFKQFKDRIWGAYSLGASSLAAAPAPIGRAGFAAFARLLWLAYAAPGSPLRRTMAAFSETIGAGPPRRIFGGYARGFTRGLYLMERLRGGHEAEIDALLDIPERDRLADLASERGALLVMAHAHGSLPMVRALGRHFPVLMVVKTTKDGARSESQHVYYGRMGCEILDVRRTGDASVARAVLKSLREGRIVVGTGDLIQKPPPLDAPIDRERDAVRAEAFGQPIGAPGWPARFALKAGAPLLPVMVEETGSRLVLHLGPVAEGKDVVTVTRDWFAGLEAMLRRYPSDWTFVFDRRWSQLLERAAAARRAADRPAPVDPVTQESRAGLERGRSR